MADPFRLESDVLGAEVAKAGVGKRLCGRIGGGATPWNQYANAGLSHWYKVCASDGQNAYPYGNTYSGQSAVNGYEGVYDLSGNAWEWEDSCDGTSGNNDVCRLRGGSFYGYVDTHLRCDDGASYDRGNPGDSVGFRCCSSP